jgi:hypothetical protein
MSKTDGGPAFAHGNPEQGGDPGMTLRDWFAGQALDDCLRHADRFKAGWQAYAAEQAYEVADAMLKERDNEA